MRTIIDVPQSMLEELDALAKTERISRAEAVRRAMAEYLKKRPRSRPDAAFGIWKSRSIDALAFEDALRREWER